MYKYTVQKTDIENFTKQLIVSTRIQRRLNSFNPRLINNLYIHILCVYTLRYLHYEECKKKFLYERKDYSLT